MANEIKFENSAYLTGYVGRDPEFKVFASGTRLAKFSIAVTPPARPGRQQTSMWFDIEAWDDYADKVQQENFGKGALVTVYGAHVPNVFKKTVNGVEIEVQKTKIRLAELDVKPKKPSEVIKSTEAMDFESTFGITTPESAPAMVAENAIAEAGTDASKPAHELAAAVRRTRGRKTA